MNPEGIHVDFPSDLKMEKMMSIAYIYLHFYIEFDEQLGITAKIEAGKELRADVLLTADQRH